MLPFFLYKERIEKEKDPDIKQELRKRKHYPYY
jgi:hypothetical protein